MKKTSITLLLALCSSIAVNVQKLHYGVTAGANLNFTAGKVHTEGTVIGYYVGMKGIYDLGQEQLGAYLTGSLALSGKGYKTGTTELKPNDPKSSTYGKANTNHLEIPVRFGLSLCIERKHKILS